MTNKKTEKTVLETAQELIYGDRQKQYGSATKNFGDMAKMWSVIVGTEISPEQVVLCMASLKICRYNHSKTTDSAVDIAGYAGCLEKLEKGL